MSTIPNIPRFYTALSECLACLLFVISIKPIHTKKKFTMLALFFLCIQIFLQRLVETWPNSLWIPGMLINIAWMFITLRSMTKLPLKKVTYILCEAFVLAEFMAAFTWHLYCYILLPFSEDLFWSSMIFMYFGYSILSMIFLYIIKKYFKKEFLVENLNNKDIIVVASTALIIFTTSNLGFMLFETSFSFGDLTSVFIFRTLINLCGLLLLYIQSNYRYDLYLRKELSSMNLLFNTNYEQYQIYKESTELIHQKFHDLKHLLNLVEEELDTDRRRSHIYKMKEEIHLYGSMIQTGNSIADVIITSKNIKCLNLNIVFTCMIDGAALSFIDTIDLISLLGNTLDNAIESSVKLAEFEKRLINLRITQKNNYIHFAIENYTEEDLIFKNGLPTTTKKNKEYHGYGLKSISYIVEKYNGNMTVYLENNWFHVDIFLPIRSTDNL